MNGQCKYKRKFYKLLKHWKLLYNDSYELSFVSYILSFLQIYLMC